MDAEAVYVIMAVIVICWLVESHVITPLSNKRYYASQGVQVTPFVPIIGDLPHVVRIRNSPNPYTTELAWWASVTRDGVGCVWLGNQLRLRIADPQFIKEVLVTHATSFDKPDSIKGILGPIMGLNNLFLADHGELHRRHRKIISPAFHFLRLKGMAAGMSDAASRAVDCWIPRSAVHSTVEIDMQEALTRLTLSIIGEAAFGVQFGDDAAQFASYARLAGLVSSAMEASVQLASKIPFYQRIMNARRAPVVSRLRRELRGMLKDRLARRTGRTVVDTHSAATMSESPTSPKKESCSDLLVDFLLDATTPTISSDGRFGRPPLALEEALDEALIFVFAGHETTAHTLCWVMYHLATQPAWAVAARAEVHRVIGSERVPSYDDIAEMPIVTAVINESMRLLPAAPTILRVATRDVSLRRSAPCSTSVSDAGYVADNASFSSSLPELHIKAGTVVQLGTGSTHRDPLLWERPEEFNPERFLAGSAPSLVHPLAFAPFGVGPRSCIGQQFAMQESRLILATLLQRTEWELAPSYVHAPIPFITLTPKFKLPMVLRRHLPA